MIIFLTDEEGGRWKPVKVRKTRPKQFINSVKKLKKSYTKKFGFYMPIAAILFKSGRLFDFILDLPKYKKRGINPWERRAGYPTRKGFQEYYRKLTKSFKEEIGCLT